MIAHNDIPNNIRVPGAYIEIDNSGALMGTPQPLHKVLMITLKNEKGNAPLGEVTRVMNETYAKEALGDGSIGAEMARYFYMNNAGGDLYVLPLEEVGTAAKGEIRLDGSATLGGVINLYIAGELIQVVVDVEAEPNAIYPLISDAINASPNLPVTATATAEKVTLTAKFKGEMGNEIVIDQNYYMGEKTPQGLAVNIKPMANGSGAPNLDDALTELGGDWYQHLIMPFTDGNNLRKLRDELVRRWGPMTQIDGMAYLAKRGTLGELSEFGLERNDHVFSCLGINGSPTPSYLIASAYAAVASKYIAIDCARPLSTLPLLGVKAPRSSDTFEATERNLLLYDGISTFTVDDGGNVLIDRAITMYRTNHAGFPDPSYLDLNTPHQMSYYRYSVRLVISKYNRHKLADDDAVVNPNQPVVKPKTIRAELIANYDQLEWNAFFENKAHYKETLQVERDPNDRTRIRVLSQPDTMNQFYIYSETARFIL